MTERIKNKLLAEPKVWVKRSINIGIVLLVLLWASTSVEFKGIQQEGFGIVKGIIKGLFTPDTNFLFDFTKTGVLYLIFETACIAFLGTIIGAIISVPFAFLCASNIVPKWLSTIGTFIVAAIRTFPAFVYGLMFIRVSGPGPFTGVLTLSVASVGMITKLYIESIEDLDTRILESLDAAGCTTFQKIRYGILPQLFTNFVSTAIYRYEINVKDATILGMVGAGGIGAPLIFAMNSYNWSKAGAILIVLVIFVLVVEFYSTKLRTKLARG